MKRQSLQTFNGRRYDVLELLVSALPFDNWARLAAEHEKNEGYMNNPEGLTANLRKKQDRTVSYNAEYWFDITSFYGN